MSIAISLLVQLCCCAGALQEKAAEDWPTWRKDPARSGKTSTALPDPLQLLWSRALPPLTPALPERENRIKLILERRQNRFPIGDQRLLLPRIRHGDAGAGPSAVEDRPVERGRKREAAAAPFKQAGERRADQRRGRGQRETGVEVGDRDPDVRRGRGELALGGADIGAAAQ